MKYSAFLLTPFIALMMSCSHEEHEEAADAMFTVTNPVRQDTVIFKDYVCQIRSIQHIEIRAMEKGYLQEIYVDEGQFVKKGQLLFQITPFVYQAEMQKSEAEVSFAEIEYQNTKRLADSNIVSKNELAMAKAHLEKAKAELSLAKTHLGFTEIRAPFDGIVDRFQVRLGSLLDEGELLTSLSDNSKMWVYFNVPEAEYLDFITREKSDSLLKVRLRMANNKMFPEMGVVETIEADFNNETGNIAFRATFLNPNKVLRHGETGNVQMPVVLNKALLIPQKATFDILDKKYVYVVDAQNTVHSRHIVTGTEMPHVFQVVEGLSEGDRILVEGLRRVKNNDHIECEVKSFADVLTEMYTLHAE